MLTINSIEEFRSKVMHKEEMRESEIDRSSTCFCYMISAEGTFDDAWSRECRGIVFNTIAGHVTGRTLHKFFNVGEREETRVENLDWSRVVRVMDKRDGSMIHSVWTIDGMRLKSKKSFASAVALAAEEWMHNQEELQVWRFISRMSGLNSTAIFEWTAPDARIVLAYSEPELRLLHVRHNVTGEYMHLDDLRTWASEFGVNMVDEVSEFFEYTPVYSGSNPPEQGEIFFNAQKMLAAAQTREGVEGWVVQFDDGEMVKVKTKWYLDRHRAMTFLRERDIAEAVLNESLDDLKSLLVSEKVNIQEILEIEAQVLHQVREIAMAVDLVYEADKHLSCKDFAIKHTGEEYFSLKMARRNGREPDFKGYFVTKLLKSRFGLRQLVLIPSVAEGD